MSSSSSPAPRGFRVVIVGGGPVGLCLAHTLSLAGIDYVLLEQRETVIEKSGFAVALWPHGVRILDQLGMLEEGRKMMLPMKDKFNMLPDGSEICHNSLYKGIEEE
jgi:2-polyprenyl-6-methoxyphenol hydroxylase-like FAD-dependent oxidoreductase